MANLRHLSHNIFFHPIYLISPDMHALRKPTSWLSHDNPVQAFSATNSPSPFSTLFLISFMFSLKEESLVYESSFIFYPVSGYTLFQHLPIH